VQSKTNERTNYASNCQADVRNFRKTLKNATGFHHVYHCSIYTNALVHGSRSISQWCGVRSHL